MLIKYKTPEMSIDGSFLEAVYHDDPASIIQIIRHVDSVKIKDKWYRLNDTEFMPATEDGEVDVLNIYLDYMDI